jgi:DNA processing protein
VVNGGAYGIDAAALRGANSVGASSIVVLASGLDRLYPAGHLNLFKAVVAYGGLIVTECSMGQHPTRAAFLRRGQLVAALGMGTVMVEAAMRSGARHTMTVAAELGRKTMAVPGPVTSAASLLPHRLISSGDAALVVDGASVLQQLGK